MKKFLIALITLILFSGCISTTVPGSCSGGNEDISVSSDYLFFNSIDLIIENKTSKEITLVDFEVSPDSIDKWMEINRKGTVNESVIIESGANPKFSLSGEFPETATEEVTITYKIDNQTKTAKATCSGNFLQPMQ